MIYTLTSRILIKKQKRPFEIITYYLFKLCPTLNNNLENIWLYKDIPNDVLKLLELPNKDKGIDLLAKINGEYYAIQSKFRHNSYKIITWNELPTFFGLPFILILNGIVLPKSS